MLSINHNELQKISLYFLLQSMIYIYMYKYCYNNMEINQIFYYTKK